MGLGLLYEKGLGVSQNTFEAIEWYNKAANQGDNDAKEKLIKLNQYNASQANPNKKTTVNINDRDAKELLKILHQYNSRDLFIAPNIPPKKLKNARQTNVTPTDEKVFALAGC